MKKGFQLVALLAVSSYWARALEEKTKAAAETRQRKSQK